MTMPYTKIDLEKTLNHGKSSDNEAGELRKVWCREKIQYTQKASFEEGRAGAGSGLLAQCLSKTSSPLLWAAHAEHGFQRAEGYL